MNLPARTIALAAVLATLVAVAAGLIYREQNRRPVSTEVGGEVVSTDTTDDTPRLQSPEATAIGGQASPSPIIPLKPDDGVKGTYSVSSKGSGPAITQVV